MFQAPELTVLKFKVEDVITASGTGITTPDDDEGFE